MRSMGAPNYRYSPWPPERRKAASDAAKARWAAKRAHEIAEWERRRASPIGRVSTRIAEERQKMEVARTEFYRAKRAVEELEKARAALEQADAIMVAQGLPPLNASDMGIQP